MTGAKRKGFLIDLEGTIVKDKTYTPIEEGLSFTKLLDERKIPWIVATNNSTEKPSDLVRILRSKGFNVDERRLVSPSLLAVEVLKVNNVKSVYFLGSKSIKDYFSENGIDVRETPDVDAVVVGIDKDINYKKLKVAASAMVINNAKLFAFHKNRVILEPDGLVGPSVGAVASCLSYAGNRSFKVFGKPSKDYFKLAFEFLGIENPLNVYMVSDDPFTDIAEGKKVVGFKTVFVLSGKYRNTEVLNSIESNYRPDYVFSNIGECKKLL